MNPALKQALSKLVQARDRVDNVRRNACQEGHQWNAMRMTETRDILDEAIDMLTPPKKRGRASQLPATKLERGIAEAMDGPNSPITRVSES